MALQGTGITTKTFDRLSQLKQLKAFNYTAADTPGSDAHLPSIIRLTNLAELSLEQGSVLSAAEMKEIGKMTNLTSLSLMTESEKDSVTELVHLKGLQHLTVITVSSNVSSAAILNTLVSNVSSMLHCRILLLHDIIIEYQSDSAEIFGSKVHRQNFSRHFFDYKI